MRELDLREVFKELRRLEAKLERKARYGVTDYTMNECSLIADRALELLLEIEKDTKYQEAVLGSSVFQ